MEIPLSFSPQLPTVAALMKLKDPQPFSCWSSSPASSELYTFSFFLVVDKWKIKSFSGLMCVCLCVCPHWKNDIFGPSINTQLHNTGRDEGLERNSRRWPQPPATHPQPAMGHTANPAAAQSFPLPFCRESLLWLQTQPGKCSIPAHLLTSSPTTPRHTLYFPDKPGSSLISTHVSCFPTSVPLPTLLPLQECLPLSLPCVQTHHPSRPCWGYRDE